MLWLGLVARGRTSSFRFLKRGGLAAVVTLKNPSDGCVPRAQTFGSTAAVFNYNCWPRVIGTLACRFLTIPRVDYFDEFGTVTPRASAKAVLVASARFNDALFAGLKESK